MARDYGRLLLLAEELQAFTGYLGTEELKKRQQFQSRFDEERMKIVYELFQEGGSADELRQAVVADLDRIELASAEYSPGAVAEAQEALFAEIEAQARNSPATRFLMRWAPVVFATVAGGIYLYLSLRSR
jgi:hypothetical protein